MYLFYKLYRSKILITQNIMLVPMQKNVFGFIQYIFIYKSFIKSNGNGNCNVKGNSNGNGFRYFDFLDQNGWRTVRERSKNGQK